VAAERGEVAAGTRGGGGVDVGGVEGVGDGALGVAGELEVAGELCEAVGEREADGAGAAAKVEDDGSRGCDARRLVDEKRGALARNEDAGVDGDAQPAELDPAQDVLERLSRDAAGDVRLERCGRGSGLKEQSCLVFGEDASGRAQPRDEGRGVG